MEASDLSPSESEKWLFSNKNKEARHICGRPLRRRRYLWRCASLTTASVLGLVFFWLWTAQPGSQVLEVIQPTDNLANGAATVPDKSYTLDPLPSLSGPPDHLANEAAAVPDKLHRLDPLASLNGPPTAQFRDNLRPDIKYITSWVSAGWTNDVMTYGNLIYLALITDRVPIIPMFTPSHVGGHVPPINFGDVFDVPRLRKALGKPVLEWADVKDRESESLDELGCWSVWQSVQSREGAPRSGHVPIHLKLDISYTKVPTWVKLIPNYEHDQHSTFWSLAKLGFPETRAANLVPPLESPNHHVSLPPDEHLLCYDYLYYVCAHQPVEYEFDYSPAWKDVVQHMHWIPSLENLAVQYVRRAIGVNEDEPTPPWIAIHVRHHDFADWCGSVSVHDCFASMTVIARRVREVKEELLERKGVVAHHVIMTSDERNTTWWEEVIAQGWYAIDHSKTGELYGEWYPVLIDAAIQSGGEGFVGTDRSTMSMLARRRVQTWRDGAVRTVKWGTPGADDH